jgi:2-polyprenyl-6-methoxyphenol hydroxylase-like FAD-dependent oxidoreductase
MSSSAAEYPVLIVGAGPTGLILALYLSQMGVPVRLIDKAAAPGMTSRAIIVQARTLELYRQIRDWPKMSLNKVCALIS